MKIKKREKKNVCNFVCVKEMPTQHLIINATTANQQQNII